MFNPTFGESTNNFASSVGVDVASGSPVVLTTTPFMAGGSKVKAADGLRLMGVSRRGGGRGGGWGVGGEIGAGIREGSEEVLHFLQWILPFSS
jgi:hypothetical protein